MRTFMEEDALFAYTGKVTPYSERERTSGFSAPSFQFFVSFRLSSSPPDILWVGYYNTNFQSTPLDRDSEF